MPSRSMAAVVGLLAFTTQGSAQEPASAAVADRLSSFIQRAYHLGLAPGLAVAVVHGDSVVYLGGIGYADVAHGRPVTPETVFYIASSTKSFTGLAAALLSLRGDVDLDGTIADYLPEARMAPGLDPAAISLRDLLTHTHGISNDGPLAFRSAYSGAGTHDEMVALIAKHRPAERGRTFRYGNIGYNVASLAMDAALGRGWKDVLADEVFRPLGMRNTTGYVSHVDPNRLALPYGAEAVGFNEERYSKSDENMHAAGGLVTTASDMARWVIANITEGRLDGRQVLPAAAFALAHRALAEEDDAYREFTREGYGLGWHVGHYDDDVMLHHFGGFSGFHAHVSFMPERRIGVVALANEAGTGSLLADLVARYAYDLLRGRPDLDAKYDAELNRYRQLAHDTRERIAADRGRRAVRPQDLPRPLEAYAGAFNNPDYGSLTFTVVGDRLEATMGPLWSRVEVYDNTKDALRVELTGGGTVVTFEFDGGDRARAIEAAGIRFTRVR